MTALAVPRQGTFDELGTPLRQTTFVVVDLETTGAAPGACEITEIGAVKVCGGDVLGTFATLVRPVMSIPPFIAVLTGITDALVAGAPPITAALPAFLEFAAGAVLVAHNAPFDIGFLRAACASTARPWPPFDVVDTARLARRVLTRDEAADCRLATLARLFRAQTQPCHRAFADAAATVDVLHGLLERVGGLGVQSLEELRTFSSQVSSAQRRKRHLAEGLPHAPGVYLFRDGGGRPLYVGKSRDLRNRVRSYFTASEPRARMAEMVGIAERVDAVPCAHSLEAEVRELRLLAEHKPRYNRRSRFPERASWIKLTPEPFPRLALVTAVRADGAAYLGPLGSRRAAEGARDALHEAFRLRRCAGRLSPARRSPVCALFELGRCGGPCAGLETVEQYAAHVRAARAAMTGDPEAVIAALEGRITRLAALERYEEAAAARDRLAAFLRVAARHQRLVALTGCPMMVAARPTDDRGWELAVIRRGRLVAAGAAPRGAAVRPYVDALVATAETPPAGVGPLPCATAEETECILRWLELPGSRLVSLDGVWSSPARGAGRTQARMRHAGAGREAASVLEDRRSLRPVHRPARSSA